MSGKISIYNFTKKIINFTKNNYKESLELLKTKTTTYNITDIENIKLIDEGGFGRIYKGTLNNNDIVIKKIKSYNIFEDYNFIKEIEIALYLQKCEYIIQLVGICQHDNFSIQMISKYYNKGNMIDFINNNNNIDILCYLMTNAQLGLGYMHSLNIIHRDIKPDNMLVNDDSSKLLLVLSDFGLSEYIPPNKYINGIYGTREYIAPEILSNNYYTLSADIYSFGITCYKVFHYHKKNNYINSIINECCKKNPNLRPKIMNIKFRNDCKNIIKYNSCKYGDKCLFNHNINTNNNINININININDQNINNNNIIIDISLNKNCIYYLKKYLYKFCICH
jgi:serine/threonine protein kinase